MIAQPWHQPELDPSHDPGLVDNQWPSNCDKCRHTSQAYLHSIHFTWSELFQIEVPHQPIRNVETHKYQTKTNEIIAQVISGNCDSKGQENMKYRNFVPYYFLYFITHQWAIDIHGLSGPYPNIIALRKTGDESNSFFQTGCQAVSWVNLWYKMDGNRDEILENGRRTAISWKLLTSQTNKQQ